MRFSPFDFDVITTPEVPASRPMPRDTVPDRSGQADAPPQGEPGGEQRDATTGEPAGQGSRAK